jgi:cell division protein FtsQ
MFKKLKEINWKKVLRLAAWSLVIACFFMTVGFTESRQHEMLCKEVNIRILNPAHLGFVEESDILQTIHDKFGVLEGKPLYAINISLLENIINNNPFVARAEVFSAVDGKLDVEVVPRNPVVRIMNSFNESFYIDKEGVFMPLSEKYSASVPLVNGFISDKEVMHNIRVQEDRELNDTSFHARTLEKAFMLADYIGHHEFWSAQVEQVFVNEEGELELIPRVGNHTIIFGSLEGTEGYKNEMTEKFNKLSLFYKEGLEKQGWDKYNTINLEYKDQIVCTKKIVNGK